MEYKFEWYPKKWVTDAQIQEYATLYSSNYGFWSQSDPLQPKRRVYLSANQLKKWFERDETNVAEARLEDELIGYAISIQTKTPKGKKISWVTQLVVHEQHRERGIGKKLLFSIWTLSDDFAWGLLSSNPYAVRALEKATRRRCNPDRIRKNKELLINFGINHVHYINKNTKLTINSHKSTIDTKFPVDHSQLEPMIKQVTLAEKPWLLGRLDEGWEWAAFTFQDQPQFSLQSDEIEQMLSASDQRIKIAYSRMQLDGTHAWAKHTDKEVDFIVQHCQLKNRDSVLDFGCGIGRHAKALGNKGFAVTAVDYIDYNIKAGKNHLIEFIHGDCRSIKLGKTFDAVICLYDVIGSFPEEYENKKILMNLAEHLKIGGYALISVMNFELTNFLAKNFFSLAENPDDLLKLKASEIMEQTGDVFDPDYFMIEKKSQIVYRREQFKIGQKLPEELIVRDKRYTMQEIMDLCAASGLNVIWSRFVRAGAWETPLVNIDQKAKEILLLCQKKHHTRC